MAASPSSPPSIADVPGGCVLSIRVIPRAKRSTFDGQRGGVWLVRLAAPPVDGAANEALVALCAAVFVLPKRSVQIVSGERAREKRVRLDGVSAAAAAERLREGREGTGA
jgi:uncharacterized protein (TIGR00251 family)